VIIFHRFWTKWRTPNGRAIWHCGTDERAIRLFRQRSGGAQCRTNESYFSNSRMFFFLIIAETLVVVTKKSLSTYRLWYTNIYLHEILKCVEIDRFRNGLSYLRADEISILKGISSPNTRLQRTPIAVYSKRIRRRLPLTTLMNRSNRLTRRTAIRTTRGWSPLFGNTVNKRISYRKWKGLRRERQQVRHKPSSSSHKIFKLIKTYNRNRGVYIYVFRVGHYSIVCAVLFFYRQ